MDRLTIGDWVEVAATVHPAYHDRRRTLDRLSKDTPGVGQVVGVTYRRTGVVKPGWNDGDDYSPAHLRVDGATMLYQVRLGMVNRPVEVLPDDLRPCDAPEGGLPWFHAPQFITCGRCGQVKPFKGSKWPYTAPPTCADCRELPETDGVRVGAEG